MTNIETTLRDAFPPHQASALLALAQWLRDELSRPSPEPKPEPASEPNGAGHGTNERPNGGNPGPGYGPPPNPSRKPEAIALFRQLMSSLEQSDQAAGDGDYRAACARLSECCAMLAKWVFEEEIRNGCGNVAEPKAMNLSSGGKPVARVGDGIDVSGPVFSSSALNHEEALREMEAERADGNGVNVRHGGLGVFRDVDAAGRGVDPMVTEMNSSRLRMPHGMVAVEEDGQIELWFGDKVSPGKNADVEFYVAGHPDMLCGYWTAETWFAWTDGEDEAFLQVERWRFAATEGSAMAVPTEKVTSTTDERDDAHNAALPSALDVAKGDRVYGAYRVPETTVAIVNIGGHGWAVFRDGEMELEVIRTGSLNVSEQLRAFALRVQQAEKERGR